MEKNYFETVCEIISSNERMKNYEFKKVDEFKAKFSSEDSCYHIEYDKAKSLIAIYSESEESPERKSITSWLMEFDKCTSKDVNMIAQDFIQVMAGKPETKRTKPSKRQSNDEHNVTGLFFANRMASMFPSLKSEIQAEKGSRGDIRIACFTENNILPCVKDFLATEKNKSKINKFGKLLSDLYHNGSLDVRSVITMGLLNGIADETAAETMRTSLSDELKKAWKASLKYKGKNVKPEKLKTRKSFMTKLLEAQKNAER